MLNRGSAGRGLTPFNISNEHFHFVCAKAQHFHFIFVGVYIAWGLLCFGDEKWGKDTHSESVSPPGEIDIETAQSAVNPEFVNRSRSVIKMDSASRCASLNAICQRICRKSVVCEKNAGKPKECVLYPTPVPSVPNIQKNVMSCTSGAASAAHRNPRSKRSKSTPACTKKKRIKSPNKYTPVIDCDAPLIKRPYALL
ncbi:hypothetical protein G7K_1688-t1 [Saitoella complicata NRRL Y-17804]|uniref:Uncharacterized protein n=1 Tax=Saitoella complicata (strain BCRC 22490 / CBS 7301 / JCM 7358 / NBRC 10748 / NRRL Y-17804) TaxID=698492 RepID=A0A0E9NC94_SAICN|nr:hypothetical protein G7K_1688-t1 [Saitoella complicata NRRL Y-17804]